MNAIEIKLAQLGIELPEAGRAAGNYQTFLKRDNRILLSGQTCRINGEMAYTGQVGRDQTVEEGKEAAKICALNLLSQLKSACGGDLSRVEQCVKLSIYVSSADGFSAQPAVANGASDLMVEIFGQRGQHVRSAVGVYALPGNSSVEVDAEFEVSL